MQQPNKKLFNSTFFSRCPICLGINSGIKLFICSNGHNTCQKCIDQSNNPDECPTCRGVYPHPPIRNLSAEGSIRAMGFPFLCSNMDCGEKFREEAEAEEHTKWECPQRLVKQSFVIAQETVKACDFMHEMRKAFLFVDKPKSRCWVQKGEPPEPYGFHALGQDFALCFEFADPDEMHLRAWLVVDGGRRKAAPPTSGIKLPWGKVCWRSTGWPRGWQAVCITT